MASFEFPGCGVRHIRENSQFVIVAHLKKKEEYIVLLVVLA